MKFGYRSRKTKYQSLIDRGFLPEEARELQKLSKYALTEPFYMRRMILSRRMTYNNAIRYGWTRREYEGFIRRKYENLPGGIYYNHDKFPDGTLNVWALVHEMERQGTDRGEKFDSRKITKPKTKKVKKQQKRGKLPTKRELLIKKIEQLQKRANKARRDVDRLSIEGEMYRHEKELRAYDREQQQPKTIREVGENEKWF